MAVQRLQHGLAHGHGSLAIGRQLLVVLDVARLAAGGTLSVGPGCGLQQRTQAGNVGGRQDGIESDEHGGTGGQAGQARTGVKTAVPNRRGGKQDQNFSVAVSA